MTRNPKFLSAALALVSLSLACLEMAQAAETKVRLVTVIAKGYSQTAPMDAVIENGRLARLSYNGISSAIGGIKQFDAKLLEDPKQVLELDQVTGVSFVKLQGVAGFSVSKGGQVKLSYKTDASPWASMKSMILELKPNGATWSVYLPGQIKPIRTFSTQINPLQMTMSELQPGY